MIYQFEHKEIKRCVNCKLCDINFDWCNMQSCLIDKYKIPQENDCPLVDISKTETTNVTSDGFSYDTKSKQFYCCACDTYFYMPQTPTFCPNCGRELEK